ncbi:DUF4249 domain-containing protein [Maribacter algarum]|uniref:DUF4249 domain-containing protein n=1 Tax=Maribacter algarum (ex Zhang et al. 2020) TaxID=2578118 RepID=A0A5S3PVR9_9FLAO|nr:DUF4249 domain-containing protein [Maribacter algarum]TMM58302.1 DUF4249 domain-containing protein [Maribacter algarum]
MQVIEKMGFRYQKFIVVFFASCMLSSCIDPVEPEFEFKEGLVFVESIASTVTKASFVTINRSTLEFGVYVVNFVEGASVNFENVGTGEVVNLVETRNSYLPPDDFFVRPGEEWKLNIQLPDGKRIESLPESVLDVVPIDNIEVRYDPELAFREILGGKFVPGHQVSIDFSDPADTENYYYWTYKSFENLDYCEQCVEAIWRNGECTPVEIARFRSRYFDYACDVDCWRIRFPESITIFDDRFSNGKSVTQFPVGDLLLFNKENIVIEVQQFSITPAAYQYYKVLQDIVDNSSGLNAPPPAALIGNLSNPDDDEDFVFGRFTAAATSTASAFINRTFIEESPLEFRDPIILEPQIASPYPPPATVIAPCSENRERTAVRPEKWESQ